MTEHRNFGLELDEIKLQLNELTQLVSQLGGRYAGQRGQPLPRPYEETPVDLYESGSGQGKIYYSGQYQGEERRLKWEPQERQAQRLLDVDSDKAAKVLAAIGHKQRLDILKAVLREPLTGAELVDRLGMGTTGQLYHHMKALQGADLLQQEERGGTYYLSSGRALPLLLLLAAASDLLDTSDYIELTEARGNAAAYLGSLEIRRRDPHYLLRALLENSILEHRAGFCSEVNVFTQVDGSVTVSDNGRGIPVNFDPTADKTRVQAVLTELDASPTFFAPGSEKGITVAVVNALSLRLSVEVRREGKIFRQDYRHGIPQSGLLMVGTTAETGTSITFLPDPDIFAGPLDFDAIACEATEIKQAYPGLKVDVHFPLSE